MSDDTATADDAVPPEGAVAEDARPDDPQPADTRAGDAPAGSSSSLEGRKRRVSVAGAMVGVLSGLLGFALVVQLHGSSPDVQLETSRPEDLVRILSDLDARQSRLRQEISDLEASRRRLESGAQGSQAALAEARRRADELGILAGTLPAEGPGLALTFAPQGQQRLPASVVLDAVQELRGAGAEAMEIQGSSGVTIRVVASTYIVDVDAGVLVDGVRLNAPYVLRVIGDPQTMRTALSIPGGVIDNARQQGGTVSVDETGTVTVSTLHQDQGLRYARPIS